jgi:hypothetical protein
MKTLVARVVALVLLLPAVTAAQLSSAVRNVSAVDAVPHAATTVTVTLRDGSPVTSMLLLYRGFGTNEFRKAEMDLRGTTATAVIRGDAVLPPFVEYYIVLVDAAGHREAYPRNPSGDPLTVAPPQLLRVNVMDESQQQILFLSPDPEAVMDPEDVMISISLLRADTSVALRATQIRLDDANITNAAVFSGDLIVLAPENLGIKLAPGHHTIKVGLFSRKGQFLRSSELSFYIRQTGTGSLLASTIPQRAFDYDADVNVESRHEQISSAGTWYNRAGVHLRGKTDIWKFSGNLFLTSDEKSDRQPQNRYYIGVATPWVEAGYGDHYPSFPDLVLSGRRVRGLQTNARYGIVGIDLTLGEITRNVEGALIKSFPADSFNVEFKRDTAAAFGQIDASTWGKFNYGTYSRKLFAVRPSIGNRETWEVGFTWMSSGDDMNSIRYGIKPQENLLLGTDFTTRLDNRRIEITGQAAFTAYNSDISSGTFNDAYVDSVYRTGAQGIKTVRDYLKRYITINDNFRPLSVAALSTLAWQCGVGLDYFDNAFHATYLFRGSDYTSFGQSYLQTDIEGIQLTDRARLLDNQMYLTLGFERLTDNTSKTKAATTVFSNINMAATWFPRNELPTVTIGFARNSNDNSIATAGHDSLSAILDATLRFYLQSSYDFVMGARHTATCSFSTSQRTDETVHKYDVSNLTGELGLTTQYSIPLQTVVSVAMYLNTIPGSATPGTSVDLNYTALSLVGRYTLIRDILTLSASIAPTFGDYKRTAADLGAEWTARPNMSFQFQLAYFHNDDGSNDNIVSLRYKFRI